MQAGLAVDGLFGVRQQHMATSAGPVHAPAAAAAEPQAASSQCYRSGRLALVAAPLATLPFNNRRMHAPRVRRQMPPCTHLKALVARRCMTSVNPRPCRILLARAPALSAPISWQQHGGRTAGSFNVDQPAAGSIIR